MIVDPKSVLFGLPSMTVRQVLRKFPFGVNGGFGWGVATLVVKDEVAAKKLVQDLVQAGLLKEETFQGSELFYERTTEGNRLAMASARPMKRATAKRKLQELLVRCGQINADSKYCYFVPRIVVFGSYVGNKDPIGDLDVAFENADRYSREGLSEGRGPMHAAWERSKKRAPDWLDWMGRLSWPETEFKKALKAGSQGLSLHDLGTDKKVVLSGPHFTVFFPTKGLPQ